MDYPKSVPGVGLVNGQFVDESPVTGTPGSLIPSTWGNAVTSEMLNVIAAAGMAPSEVDLTQLLKAIGTLGQSAASSFAIDTGTANNYVCNFTPAISARVEGQPLRFKVKTANTGACTINDGLGAVAMVGGAHSPLRGGELVANGDAWVQWNTSIGGGSYILLFCTGAAEQIAPATQSQHAAQLGQITGSVTSISADTTLTAAQKGLVIIDATASNRTITLPTANAALGVTDFIVRRLDNTTNSLVVTASGTDKIKFHTHLNAAGYSFLVLMGACDYWHLRSDGAGSWWPVSRYDGTPLGRSVLETTSSLSPGGYGAMNGSLFARAAYPWLWDHAQQSGMLTTEAARAGMEGGWTSGDGATTFRCPDVRGRFQRCADETAAIDPNRAAGSSQASQLGAHNHSLPGGGTFGTTMMGGGTNNYAQWVAGASGYAGGSETRPINIAYPGRIKLI